MYMCMFAFARQQTEHNRPCVFIYYFHYVRSHLVYYAHCTENGIRVRRFERTSVFYQSFFFTFIVGLYCFFQPKPLVQIFPFFFLRWKKEKYTKILLSITSFIWIQSNISNVDDIYSQWPGAEFTLWFLLFQCTVFFSFLNLNDVKLIKYILYENNTNSDQISWFDKRMNTREAKKINN